MNALYVDALSKEENTDIKLFANQLYENGFPIYTALIFDEKCSSLNREELFRDGCRMAIRKRRGAQGFNLPGLTVMAFNVATEKVEQLRKSINTIVRNIVTPALKIVGNISIGETRRIFRNEWILLVNFTAFDEDTLFIHQKKQKPWLDCVGYEEMGDKTQGRLNLPCESAFIFDKSGLKFALFTGGLAIKVNEQGIIEFITETDLKFIQDLVANSKEWSAQRPIHHLT